MPLFEYRCTECGDVTEFLESASAKGPHECGSCGSKKTEKVFSVFAAQNGASRPAPAGCEGQCQTGACPFANS